MWTSINVNHMKFDGSKTEIFFLKNHFHLFISNTEWPITPSSTWFQVVFVTETWSERCDEYDLSNAKTNWSSGKQTSTISVWFSTKCEYPKCHSVALQSVYSVFWNNYRKSLSVEVDSLDSNFGFLFIWIWLIWNKFFLCFLYFLLIPVLKNFSWRRMCIPHWDFLYYSIYKKTRENKQRFMKDLSSCFVMEDSIYVSHLTSLLECLRNGKNMKKRNFDLLHLCEITLS